ncbi:MAG: hypoxanthine phosphoribosyltransferase, partial [Deltaproteobacteria bacterium]|nr:hypoxanthine phosphoribosyltransferase [Deltaproteobacteria bacterium]
MNNHTLHLVLSQERNNERVKALAEDLSAKYAGTDVVLVGALNGVFIFMADLVRQMTMPVSIDFIRLASYGSA